MGQQADDVLKRVYARLTALKTNIPDSYDAVQEYVIEYHKLLTQLKTIGFDLGEFRIPEETYSKSYSAIKTFFLMKLDGLLAYFTLTYDDRKPQIGFAPGGR